MFQISWMGCLVVMWLKHWTMIVEVQVLTPLTTRIYLWVHSPPKLIVLQIKGTLKYWSRGTLFKKALVQKRPAFSKPTLATIVRGKIKETRKKHNIFVPKIIF